MPMVKLAINMISCLFSRNLVPASYRNEDIILCLMGCICLGMVNGTFVRIRGFTPWECNITGLVTRVAGSWWNNRQKERTVLYMPNTSIYTGAVLKPSAQPVTCHVVDGHGYRDAILTLDMSLKLVDAAEITVTLLDPLGRAVKLDANMISLATGVRDTLLKYPVMDPLKWDAEHPNLYTLKLLLTQKGKKIQETIHKVGFRSVNRGNEMLTAGLLNCAHAPRLLLEVAGPV
jgi:hypothetical protein